MMKNTGASEPNLSIAGTEAWLIIYESIKGELISNRTELPNPAVYAIESAFPAR